MVVWKAHYTDEHHDLDIDILNTEEDYRTVPLSFCINGISFSGTSLGDFQLCDSAMYETAQKEFHILKQGGKNIKYNFPSQTPYSYDLQRYSLDVSIPIQLFRKNDYHVVQGNLRICFTYCEHDMQKLQAIHYCDDEIVYLDDIESAVFTLNIGEKEYSVNSKDLCFEDNLLKLSQMIKSDYTLKCCFTCQYSDYSPFGNDDYGTMLCYRHHKEAYLKVNDKASYFKYIEGLDYEARQETYCCEEYTQRNQCSGYRGFVD